MGEGDAAQARGKPRAHLGLKVVACAVALAVCCAVAAASAMGLFLPRWVNWENGVQQVDLDLDGLTETVELASRSLRVRGPDGGELYATPDSWRVSQVTVADATGDGMPELLMLVWRRGNYGTSRPFWDTGFDLRMTQHLYVMGLRDGAVVPVWMSHELGEEVARAEVSPSGVLVLTARDGSVTQWVWEGFGFVAV